MGVHHVAYATADLDATHRFYTEVMGFEVTHHALHIYGLCPDCQKERDKK